MGQTRVPLHGSNNKDRTTLAGDCTHFHPPAASSLPHHLQLPLSTASLTAPYYQHKLLPAQGQVRAALLEDLGRVDKELEEITPTATTASA